MSGYCEKCGNTLCICNWEKDETLEKQLTAETFANVVNAPASPHELRAVEIVELVVNSPNADLVLKSIVRRMLSLDWEGTQQVINDAVSYHPNTGAETELLDISWHQI